MYSVGVLDPLGQMVILRHNERKAFFVIFIKQRNQCMGPINGLQAVVALKAYSTLNEDGERRLSNTVLMRSTTQIRFSHCHGDSLYYNCFCSKEDLMYKQFTCWLSLSV